MGCGMSDHNPLYGDACERCGQYDVTPAAAIRDGDTGIVCGYRCPNCRAAWTCSWGIFPGHSIPPAIDRAVRRDHSLCGVTPCSDCR